MRTQNMPIEPAATEDWCPICGAKIKLAEVEPHPHRSDLDVLGFTCDFCGPVKSLVVISIARKRRLL